MAKVIVYHSEYGCDTGCCGHTVELREEDGTYDCTFEFAHPYGTDSRTWAEAMVRAEYGEEHVKDLDWDNCVISED